ncbi:hypothetical protein Anas_10620 [Armadillidium nasatum]|uniref:Uncharacterized protein n=1 Tax=Armadillidium nasatum TaxID=96803 RepID=A0A5N5SKK1_9CRUS|nr:hypothetical protein Anas_10620 [Armadillidium nasatum]
MDHINIRREKNDHRFVLVLRVSGVDSSSVNKAGLVSILRSSYSETSGVHIRKITLELEVVERNRFKELCHLSLSLAPASLETKLVYLSSCLKDLKYLQIKLDKTVINEGSVPTLKIKFLISIHETKTFSFGSTGDLYSSY